MILPSEIIYSIIIVKVTIEFFSKTQVST